MVYHKPYKDITGLVRVINDPSLLWNYLISRRSSWDSIFTYLSSSIYKKEWINAILLGNDSRAIRLMRTFIENDIPLYNDFIKQSLVLSTCIITHKSLLNEIILSIRKESSASVLNKLTLYFNAGLDINFPISSDGTLLDIAENHQYDWLFDWLRDHSGRRLSELHIPCVEFFPIINHQEEDDVCSICLSNRRDVSLVCHHSFHKECIKQHLYQSPLCPLCRRMVGFPL